MASKVADKRVVLHFGRKCKSPLQKMNDVIDFADIVEISFGDELKMLLVPVCRPDFIFGRNFFTHNLIPSSSSSSSCEEYVLA